MGWTSYETAIEKNWSYVDRERWTDSKRMCVRIPATKAKIETSDTSAMVIHDDKLPTKNPHHQRHR